MSDYSFDLRSQKSRAASATLSARSLPDRKDSTLFQPGRIRAKKAFLDDGDSLTEGLKTSASARQGANGTIETSSRAYVASNDPENLKEENKSLKKKVIDLEDEKMKLKTKMTVMTDKLDKKEKEVEAILDKIRSTAGEDGLKSKTAQAVGNEKYAEMVKKLKIKVKTLEDLLAASEDKLSKTVDMEFHHRHEELELMNKNYQTEILRLQTLVSSRYVENTRSKIMELENDNGLLSRELFELIKQKRDTDEKVVDTSKKVEKLQDIVKIMEIKNKEDIEKMTEKYILALRKLSKENQSMKENLLESKQSVVRLMQAKWEGISQINDDVVQKFQSEIEGNKRYHAHQIMEMTAEFTRKMKEMEREKESLLQEIKSRDRVIEDLNDTIKELRATISDLKGTTKTLENIIEQAHSSISELNTTTQQLRASNKEKDDKIDDLNRVIDKQKSEIDSLRSFTIELKGDIGNKENQITRLQLQLDDSNAQIKKGRDEIASLSRDIEGLRSDLEEAKNNALEARSAHTETKREFQSAKEDMEKLRETIMGLTVEKNEYFEKLSDMKNKLEEAESQIRSVIIERDSVKEELQRQRKKQDDLENTIKDLTGEVDQYKIQHKQKDEELQGRLGDITRIQAYLEYCNSTKNEGETDNQSTISFSEFSKRNKGKLQVSGAQKFDFDFLAYSVKSGHGGGSIEGYVSDDEFGDVQSHISGSTAVTGLVGNQRIAESTLSIDTIPADGKLLQHAYEDVKKKEAQEVYDPSENGEIDERKIIETQKDIMSIDRAERILDEANDAYDKEQYHATLDKLNELVSVIDEKILDDRLQFRLFNLLGLANRANNHMKQSIENFLKCVRIPNAIDHTFVELGPHRTDIERKLGKNELSALKDLACTLILQDEENLGVPFIEKWIKFFTSSRDERFMQTRKDLELLPTKKLHMALHLNLKNLTRQLMEQNDLNEPDSLGCTPLHYAVMASNIDHVVLLLERRADPNIAANLRRNKKTCLHYVSDAQILEKLIQAGANVGVEDENLDTPLHNAAFQGYNEIARQLIEHGAQANAANNRRRTPLHNACLNGHEPVADLLLTNGANVDAIDDGTDTPLLLAIKHESEDLASLLLERQANIRNQDNEGNTALHHAVIAGFDDIVEQIMGMAGASDIINLQNAAGQTALHIALENDSEYIATFLVEKGAGLDIADSNGKKPLDLTSDAEITEKIMGIKNSQ